MELPLLALGWLLGFAAVGVFHAPWWMGGAWCAALVPLAWLLGGRRRACLLAVAAVAALGGGARFDGALDRTPPALLAFVGEEVQIEGRIAGEADPKRVTVEYRFEADRILLGGAWQPIDGAVLAVFGQYRAYLPGDRLRLEGTIQAVGASGDFDYGAYLLGRGVVGRVLYPGAELLGTGRGFAHWSADLRRDLVRAIERALPEPEAALAAGIAIGRDETLPDPLVDDYRDSGLAHLTAVSGGNVAILGAVVFWLFAPLVGRFRVVVPLAVLTAFYLVAAGFSPSIVRASIMAWIFLFGLVIGRPQGGLPALAVAAVAMTALDPRIAVDVGFQLSLAATAGLIALSPWVRWTLDALLAKARVGHALPPVVTEAAALTLSATIATLPIVAAVFGRVSLVGVLANIVAGPLFLLAFPLSLAVAVCGLLWAPLAWLVGIAAYYPLAATNALASGSAAVPFAAIEAPVLDARVAFVSLVVLVAVGAWGASRYPPELVRRLPGSRGRRLVRAAYAAAAVAFGVAVLRTTVLPAAGPGRLEVHFLDVGQGDAILLRTPAGRNVLVDGGPSGIDLARQLGAALPHWDRTIDRVVLTHPDGDHVGGLAAVYNRFAVRETLDGGLMHTTEVYAAFAAAAETRTAVATGDRETIDGVTLEVLWPAPGHEGGPYNDASVILLVRYGDARILLTGDIEDGPQGALLAEGAPLAADVLKVPHHGAATSDPAFFDVVGPALAVIQVGEGNRYGHPAPVTLADLGDVTVLRTDQDGRVVVRTDGRRITVETSR